MEDDFIKFLKVGQTQINKKVYYNFLIHDCAEDGEKGYWAECLELNGCITQGETWEQVLKNCKEVLELFLDDNKNYPEPFKLKTDRTDIVAIPVEIITEF